MTTAPIDSKTLWMHYFQLNLLGCLLITISACAPGLRGGDADKNLRNDGGKKASLDFNFGDNGFLEIPIRKESGFIQTRVATSATLKVSHNTQEPTHVIAYGSVLREYDNNRTVLGFPVEGHGTLFQFPLSGDFDPADWQFLELQGPDYGNLAVFSIIEKVIQQGNALYVIGHGISEAVTAIPVDFDIFIVKLDLTTGVRDINWGTNGITRINLGTTTSSAHGTIQSNELLKDAILKPNNQLALWVRSNMNANEGNYSGYLLKLDLTTGVLDTTFGTGGALTLNYPGSAYGQPESCAFQPLRSRGNGFSEIAFHQVENRLTSVAPQQQQTFFKEYFETGLNPQFGNQGELQIYEHPNVFNGRRVSGMQSCPYQLSDGSLIHYLKIDTSLPDSRHQFRRILPQGQTDASFGSNGVLGINEPSSGYLNIADVNLFQSTDPSVASQLFILSNQNAQSVEGRLYRFSPNGASAMSSGWESIPTLSHWRLSSASQVFPSQGGMIVLGSASPYDSPTQTIAEFVTARGISLVD